jgi:hypothetical protein
MTLSEESRQKIHSYMDSHDPSNIHHILGQILLSGILIGKEMFPNIKESEYHIFSENALGYSVYALYKDVETVYCIRCGYSGGGYSVYGYCLIENNEVFDKYIF